MSSNEAAVQSAKPSPASLAFVLTAGCTWGLTGACNRMLAPFGISSLQVGALRCIVAVLGLALFLLFFDKAAFRIRLRDIWCFLGTGLLSFALLSFSYFSAMREMSLSAAVVLMYTAPIYVVLLSAPLFKERITGRKVAALALVVAGAVCTTGLLAGEVAITAAGLFYGALSGLSYGFYSIFSRFALQRGYSAHTITFYTVLFGAAALTPLANLASMPQDFFCPEGLFWALMLGLVCTVAPYLFYTRGLKGMENGLASILSAVEMVVATLISALVFGEAFTFMNGVGVVLVLAGIVVMNAPAAPARPGTRKRPA